jgi:hypothetical protein
LTSVVRETPGREFLDLCELSWVFLRERKAVCCKGIKEVFRYSEWE